MANGRSRVEGERPGSSGNLNQSCGADLEREMPCPHSLRRAGLTAGGPEGLLHQFQHTERVNIRAASRQSRICLTHFCPCQPEVFTKTGTDGAPGVLSKRRESTFRVATNPLPQRQRRGSRRSTGDMSKDCICLLIRRMQIISEIQGTLLPPICNWCISSGLRCSSGGS